MRDGGSCRPRNCARASARVPCPASRRGEHRNGPVEGEARGREEEIGVRRRTAHRTEGGEDAYRGEGPAHGHRADRAFHPLGERRVVSGEDGRAGSGSEGGRTFSAVVMHRGSSMPMSHWWSAATVHVASRCSLGRHVSSKSPIAPPASSKIHAGVASGARDARSGGRVQKLHAIAGASGVSGIVANDRNDEGRKATDLEGADTDSGSDTHCSRWACSRSRARSC